MSYTLSGHYIASCSCAVLCGCPTDAPPRDLQGGSDCRGVAVFHIADGRLDDTDLSGVDFAFYNLFPSNLTSGDWKVGLVVDNGASDGQATALERVVSGREGGPFEQLAQFIGDYLGMERGAVALSDGDAPGLAVEGRSQIAYQSKRGQDGNPTTVKNAMFGFAPEFEVGTSSGHSEAFGLTFDASYGEQADFLFTSETEAGRTTGRM